MQRIKPSTDHCRLASVANSINKTIFIIDEFADWDLSSNNFHPSFIKVKNNKKRNKIKIKARVFDDLGDDDTLDTRDFFILKVPKKSALKSIKLDKDDNSSYGDNKGGGGWLGVANGGSIPDLNNPTGLIGGHLIGTTEGASEGDEIMDDMEQEFQFGEAIVPGLLPEQISGGKFTFWFQEGNFDSPNDAYVDYTLTFTFRWGSLEMSAKLTVRIVAPG